MRKEYGKALRDLFTARMKEEFPDWRPVPAPKPWYWPGERVFVQDRHAGVWLVVVLQPDDKDHDAFNVEIGWSTQQRIPELTMRPCADDPAGEDALSRDEYVCRLSELVPGKEKLDGWVDGWVIDPRTFSTNPQEGFTALVDRGKKLDSTEARSVVSPFVDEVIAALAQFGIPYLESKVPALAERSASK